MLTQFLKGKTIWKISPFSRGSGQTEKKRPGRGGGNMGKGRARVSANHIAWINVVPNNIRH